jgi:hypothetical protein
MIHRDDLEGMLKNIIELMPNASRDEALLLLWRLKIITVQEYLIESKLSERRSAYNRLKKLANSITSIR